MKKLIVVLNNLSTAIFSAGIPVSIINRRWGQIPIDKSTESIYTGTKLKFLNSVFKFWSNSELLILQDSPEHHFCAYHYCNFNSLTLRFYIEIQISLYFVIIIRAPQASTSSPSSSSWIFKALVPAREVVADDLAFVHGIVVGDQTFGIQRSLLENKEFGNLGRQGRRRPAEA